MLEEHDVERLLENGRIETSRELDARVLAAASAAFDEHRADSPKRRFAIGIPKWRTVAGLSIAASVLLVVGVGAYMLLQQKTSAAEMLRRAAESTGEYEGWVHITGQISGAGQSGGRGPESIEAYLNPADGTEISIRQHEGKQSINMYRPSRQEMMEYDSGSNEVWIRSVEAEAASSVADGEPTISWMLAGLRRGNKSDGITASRTRENHLDRYDIVYPAEVRQNRERPVHAAIQRVWVDPTTQLIRRTWVQSNGETLTLDWSYGERSIHDIYDLGVPRDARVVDTRPETHEARIAGQFDLNALRHELKRRVEAGFGDHTAMVMQSHVGADGALAPWFVHLIRKRGPYERTDTLYVGDNQEMSNLHQYVAQVWPNLAFPQAFDIEAKGPVESRVISGPTEVVLSNQFLGGATRRFPAGSDRMGEWSMACLAWRYREVFEPGPMHKEKIDLTLLPMASRPEPWIGVRAVRTDKALNGEATQRTDEYWYNPTRGYVLMESSTTYDRDPDAAILSSKRVTVEVGQIATGEAYPRHIRETLKLWRDPGKTKTFDAVREEHILLDTSLVPDEGLFAADQAPVRR